MNPGEYIGKDGGEYRWLYSDVMGWIVRDERGCVTGMKREDVGDAKAALDALVEAESEEWVEIDDHARIKRDGTAAQWRHGNGYGQNWHPLSSDDKRWPQAYRKGREVALEEGSDLRDAARKASGAIVDELSRECSRCHEDAKCDEDLKHRCCIGCPVSKALAVAKTLEGKL